MVGLIKTLLIFGAIYFIGKFLSIFIIPFFRRPVNKNSRQHRNEHDQQRSRKEGDVNIDYIPDKDKKFSKDKGEYVDYEEVKED